MLRVTLIANLFFMSAAGAAFASTPDSWRDLRLRSDQACIAVSGLSKAKVIGYADGFQAVTVSIVVGVYPGKRAKGVKGRVLCVFDKRTGKAEAQEPAL